MCCRVRAPANTSSNLITRFRDRVRERRERWSEFGREHGLRAMKADDPAIHVFVGEQADLNRANYAVAAKRYIVRSLQQLFGDSAVLHYTLERDIFGSNRGADAICIRAAERELRWVSLAPTRTTHERWSRKTYAYARIPEAHWCSFAATVRQLAPEAGDALPQCPKDGTSLAELSNRLFSRSFVSSLLPPENTTYVRDAEFDVGFLRHGGAKFLAESASVWQAIRRQSSQISAPLYRIQPAVSRWSFAKKEADVRDDTERLFTDPTDYVLGSASRLLAIGLAADILVISGGVDYIRDAFTAFESTWHLAPPAIIRSPKGAYVPADLHGLRAASYLSLLTPRLEAAMPSVDETRHAIDAVCHGRWLADVTG